MIAEPEGRNFFKSSSKTIHSNIVAGGYYYIEMGDMGKYRHAEMKVLELNDSDAKIMMMRDFSVVTLKYGEEYKFNVSPHKHTIIIDKKR